MNVLPLTNLPQTYFLETPEQKRMATFTLDEEQMRDDFLDEPIRYVSLLKTNQWTKLEDLYVQNRARSVFTPDLS